MSECQISLPEDVYQALIKAAQENGVTPTDWIVSKLPLTSGSDPLSELLSGLVGAINSQEEPHHRYPKTLFGTALARKLAKQGIHRP